MVHSTKSQWSALSVFCAGCVLSLCSALSIGSFLSFFSVGSVASIASVGSLLSIGSYRSVLSIGCDSMFLAVCNGRADAAATTSAAPPASPFTLLEVRHNPDHATNYDGCQNNESVSLQRHVFPASAVGWKLYVFDDDERISTAGKVPIHTYTETNVSETLTTCLGHEVINKKDVVVLFDADGVRRDVAQMSKYYTWTKGGARSDYRVVTSADITVTAEDWAAMSRCTLAEKESKTPPPHCDYKNANCSINGAPAVECEVKRKGHASWRDMGKKPSLKLKLKESQSQRKLTLNNMAQDRSNGAEVTSYAVFASYGVPASRANHARVRFWPLGAPSLPPAEMYTSVENPDTPEFLAAHGLDGHSIWEVEKAAMKHELGHDYNPKKEIQDAVDTNDLAQLWKVIDKGAFFRYYAAEMATGHWDGLCRDAAPLRRRMPVHSGNNAFAVRGHDGRYIFVPWGLDQTNTCTRRTKTILSFDWFAREITMMPEQVSTCAPMQMCMEAAGCRRDFRKFTHGFHDMHRCEIPGILWQWVFVGLLLVLGITLAVLWLVARPRAGGAAGKPKRRQTTKGPGAGGTTGVLNLLGNALLASNRNQKRQAESAAWYIRVPNR